MALSPPLSKSLVLLLSLLLCLFSSSILVTQSQPLTHQRNSFGTRKLLDDQDDHPIKKKTTTTTSTSTSTSLSTKNQTKPIKPTTTKINSTKSSSSSNGEKQSKPIKLIPSSSDSVKNKTKLMIKPTSGATKEAQGTTLKSSQLIKKQLNSTSTKPTNSTKVLTKKPSDLNKLSTPKNKTTKPISPKLTKPPIKQKPSWIDGEDDYDLVSEFRDLPTRFQETLLPDLERISSTSKVYLNRANKEITNGFKPFVGKKYAPTIASIVSFAFILIPLILVSLIFHRIKAYFSLQKLLIFIQIYLSIYFSILCLSTLVTGIEPLRFLYATSRSTYVCLQVLQTLGYVLYLLLLLMYFVLVFSTDTGFGSKVLGLGQMVVGFAVGLHYYVAVFHRVVLHQPPKTSWRVHGIYATCFLLICLLANADRRKKAYLEDGGEEGKKS